MVSFPLFPLAYIGNTEILIIAGVVIVLFGGSKMAQLGKGLGEGIREFKKSMEHEEKPSDKDKESNPVKPQDS